tara:strand:- start:6780 stop:7436 length:657 start_codon:yes stop_codon:yes gene_type:complete
MKKRLVLSISLLILLTTITTQKKSIISSFNLEYINIENNFLLEDKEIKKLLLPIYNKNLIFLNYEEIEKNLMQNDFIDSFKVKKRYPNSLRIEVFEKKPIAILQNKKKKYYISEKIDLIQFKSLQNFENLPFVIGNSEDFKIFYNNLGQINFPKKLIKKYIFYESNRWDLETTNKEIIKLPPTGYIKSLKNYLELKDKNDFKKYKIFDYRISNQVILK